MRNLLLLIFILINAGTYAHVGSPDIVYEGNAGPYRILATIQPPDVVPGIARILIDVSNDKNARLNKVIVQPVYYQYGSEGAPAGDPAMPVPGEKNIYQGELWLMTFGSSSVKVSIEGSKGYGSTVIPVPAVATATRTMDATTGIVLSVLGIFLVVSIVSIIGACIKEATLVPGKAAEAGKGRQAALVMAISLVLLVSGLAYANKWWSSVEKDYKRNMFRPLSLKAGIAEDEGKDIIKLNLQNEEWLSRKLSDLVPDHGKIMHLFLINPKAELFAHLHPERIDSAQFITELPGLSPGNYMVFAEVVHANGMAETMTDTLAVGKVAREKVLSGDDFAGMVPFEEKQAVLDGLQVKPLNTSGLKAGRPVKLEFQCSDSDGSPALLESYLGMAGHAVVMKDDASVFIHLHPMGTISMASQYALAQKLDESVTICGTLDDSTMAAIDTTGVMDKQAVSLMRGGLSEDLRSGKVVFPYVFPRAGTYYVWVQLKYKGKIKTAGFKVAVV